MRDADLCFAIVFGLAAGWLFSQFFLHTEQVRQPVEIIESVTPSDEELLNKLRKDIEKCFKDQAK